MLAMIADNCFSHVEHVFFLIAAIATRYKMIQFPDSFVLLQPVASPGRAGINMTKFWAYAQNFVILNEVKELGKPPHRELF